MRYKSTYTMKPSIFARIAMSVRYDVKPLGFDESKLHSVTL